MDWDIDDDLDGDEREFMKTETAIIPKSDDANKLELALVAGDLSKLTPEQRLTYYNRVCESVGLNPFTRPFEYILLNGKLTLYAKKDATDQLRKIHNVSIQIVSREHVEGAYVVCARATMPNGRTDESIGAVGVGSLKGDGLANSLMKSETKAKRRVTLSVCGLGFLDESEVETIPQVVRAPLEVAKKPELNKPSISDAARRLKGIGDIYEWTVPQIKEMLHHEFNVERADQLTAEQLDAAENILCGERMAKSPPQTPVPGLQKPE